MRKIPSPQRMGKAPCSGSPNGLEATHLLHAPSPTTTESPHEIFPPPALPRRARLLQSPAVHLTGADKAYLETCDLLDAYPGCEADILRAIRDTQRIRRWERAR